MRALDPALKHKVLDEHRQGVPPAKLAQKYGLSIGTIKSWVQRNKAASPKPPGKVDASPQDGRMHPDEHRRAGKRGAPLGNQNAVGNKGGGAPPGNKNGLVTGSREAIWLDALEPDEQAMVRTLNTDKLVQLDNEIAITDVRIRRMLQHIARLVGVDFTVVKRKYEAGIPLVGARAPAIDSSDGPMRLPMTEQEEHGTLGQIIRIEEALTRVQAHKARLIELKHKLTNGSDDGEGGVDEFMEALNGAGDVWDGEH